MNAFVLAGGQSTRMGRDKALLTMNGQPLVEHMLELLRGLDLRPRICGSRPDLHPDATTAGGPGVPNYLARFAEVVPDNFAQCGPLGGMEAALAVSDSELNLFVPVDAPGTPSGFLRWMMDRAETSHAVATIPRCGDRPQPLCAIYSRRLLEGLRGSLAAGECKVMTAIEGAAAALGEAVDAFDEEAIAATGPAGWPLEAPAAWFRNVNTPTDYAGLVGAGKR